MTAAHVTVEDLEDGPLTFETVARHAIEQAIQLATIYATYCGKSDADGSALQVAIDVVTERAEADPGGMIARYVDPLERDLARMLQVVTPDLTHAEKQAKVRELAAERRARQLRRVVVPIGSRQ